MTTEYDKCLKNKKITPIKNGKNFVAKTLKSAEFDLETAQKAAKDKNYKWATIQTYYSMFNCARALLYDKRLCEKNSHYCLIQAIKTLYVGSKQLDVSFIEAIQEAKDLREEANYRDNWDEKSCKRLMKKAEEFIKRAKELLK